MPHYIFTTAYLLLTFFASTKVAADFFGLPDSHLGRPTQRADGSFSVSDRIKFLRFFIVPNEREPLDAENILSLAKPGLLISVGSERVYFDAILAPRVTHILALDYDPEIIRFHRINEILIRASSTLERYHELRLKSASWKFLKPDQQLNLSKADLNFIRLNAGWWRDNFEPLDHEKEFKFDKRVRYWDDDNAYRRIKEIVDRKRFRSYKIDLSQRKLVDSLVGAINIPISVVDLSNAWDGVFPNIYIGAQGTNYLLSQIDQVAKPSTILVVTRGTAANQCDGSKGILYFGTDFKFLRANVAAPDLEYGFKAWETAYNLLDLETARINGPEDRFVRSRVKFGCKSLIQQLRMRATVAPFPSSAASMSLSRD